MAGWRVAIMKAILMAARRIFSENGQLSKWRQWRRRRGGENGGAKLAKWLMGWRKTA
jgi:hypothetical protein